ncbi:MAG: hypothetical protein AB1324_07155 [Candidatus Micrarchaeota archaeon]
MDRSYIVECKADFSGNKEDVTAVVFMNTEPSRGMLADLGLSEIGEICETKPQSRQPTEPTLYYFRRGAPASSVSVVRFGMDGRVSSCETAKGEPHRLIPPVSGPAADKLLYPTSAFIVAAHVRNCGRSVPVTGVVFVRPAHGEETLNPHSKKAVDRMGLVSIQSVDKAGCAVSVPHNTLYLFERPGIPSSLTVSRLAGDGSVLSSEVVAGDPFSIIPSVTGSAAERFLNPRAGKSLLPGRASEAPPLLSQTPAKHPNSQRNRS